MQISEHEWTLTVLALSERREPATEAHTLFLEDETSRARREQQLTKRRLYTSPGREMKGCPTKKSRRLVHRFIEGLD